MADSFDVQPKRGDPYKTTNFTKTLGSIFFDGYIPGLLNNFDIDLSPGGLNFKVKTGRAILGGCFVELSSLSDTKSVPASSTRQVFISLTLNGSLRVTGAQIEILNSTLPSTPYIQIAELTSDGSNITNVDLKNKPVSAPKYSPNLFGDGSDGDLHVTSGTTTLTTTKYYNNVTIDAGCNLTANEPMVLFVKNTLHIKGNLHMDGKGGAGGAGGASTRGTGGGNPPSATPGPAGCPSLPGTPATPAVGGAGVGGKNRSSGNAPSGGTTTGIGGAGGEGPAPGGSPGSGAPDGPAGPTPANTALNIGFHNSIQSITIMTISPVALGTGAGGSGGAGAGSGGGGAGKYQPAPGGGLGGGPAATGGSGGAGGGTLILVARNVIIDSGGRISVDGINGSVGANGANPSAPLNGSPGTGGGGGASGCGGSGGGGGDGGTLIMIYLGLLNNGTIRASKGTGGAGGTAAPAHGTGGAGASPSFDGVAGSGPLTAGSTGSNGVDGVIIQHSP